MIRPIIRDIFFLGQKSEPAAKQDLGVGQDLMDTLQANKDRCVGMAANMREAMRKARRHACMDDRLTNAATEYEVRGDWRQEEDYHRKHGDPQHGHV